jgi:type IV pilus assembly protein PilN
MLRTNLSTRPFYNERLVHLALALVGLIVAVITVLNIVKVVQLSRQSTTLTAGIRDDRAAAEDFARRAKQTRLGIDQKALKVVVASAQEANELIDSRTFSWTGFFNYIEATLPPDVMLVSVRPLISEGKTVITMAVRARRSPDIDEFIEKLEATGAFEDIFPLQQNVREDGLIDAPLQAVYTPAAEGAAPSPQPAPAPKPGAAAPAVPAASPTATGSAKRGTS